MPKLSTVDIIQSVRSPLGTNQAINLTESSRIRKARQVTDGHRKDRREKSLQLSRASCWIMGRKTSRFSIFLTPLGTGRRKVNFSNLKISSLLILLLYSENSRPVCAESDLRRELDLMPGTWLFA